MRTKLFFAAFAALALASCNEAPMEAPVTDEMVELEVNVPVVQTRLTGTPAAEDAATSATKPSICSRLASAGERPR